VIKRSAASEPISCALVRDVINEVKQKSAAAPDSPGTAPLAEGRQAGETAALRDGNAGGEIEALPKRWEAAAAAAVGAMESLHELQVECEEWRNALPESLQDSPTAEKLDAVCALDLNSALEIVQEAESTELPRGYGKD